METKQFLQSVVASEGYYCVWGFKGDRLVTKFYDSIDKVIDTATKLDSNGYNAFFALATFEKSGSRKVENAKQYKSFFLDLDCGDKKDYPTQQDALTALRGFCKKNTLPKPVIVSSGNGVHCYWPLETPIIYSDWFPVAERLKALCAEHNLLADPAVTSDGARVLRVPETHNHKGDTPIRVHAISSNITTIPFHEFSELIGEIIPAPKTLPMNQVDSKVADSTEAWFVDIIRKTKEGRGCEQIKNIIINQKDISEPLWRGGLSITKFCVDSEEASKIISEKHLEYSEEKTQEKLDLIKGPYWCTTFDEHNPDVCPNCPNWKKVKSPIVLGNRIIESEEDIKKALAMDLPEDEEMDYKVPSKYPSPYFRGSNGGVYMRYKNADGDPEDKLIYHNDLYVVNRITDAETGEGVVMRLHLPRDGVREFTVPLTAVTSKEDFRKQLSMQGVAVPKMDDLMKYTTTWVNELQVQEMADIAHKQFGWTNDECGSFILGNKEISKDSVKFNAPSLQTASFFPYFEPKGELEKWKEMINFYDRDDFELHQFVVATSFGSPLMQFLPIHCATLHLHGDTGIGKTTVQMAAVSVWGNPSQLICSENDTVNTKMNRGEVYRNLPLYIDELTNEKPKDLSDLAYRLTGGRQRNRMSAGSNVERYRGEPWRLLAVTSANASIVEMISMIKIMPKAEAQRILECKTKEMRFDTKEETDAFSLLLTHNYGHAGRIYLKSILNDIEGVKKLLKEVQIKIDTTAGLTAKNRFWSALTACSLTGIILAKKAGLVNYDVKNLFKWTVGQLKRNLHMSNDMSASVEEVINDYIHEHWSNVLWIKSTDDLRGKEGDEISTLVVPEAVPRGKLVARYETDLKKAYLLPKPLKKWCVEQQINYTSFIQDLKLKLNGKKGKVRLSKGTHMNLPPTHVIIIDCTIQNETGSTEEL
jgi:hypothetical protein|tara:strand:+ start:7564 stop:10350 length:2787 start_codon:yes stop_codon:yes gene_type:complete